MRPTIVGIINTTPDSFSDGGRFLPVDAAVAHAGALLADGADVIEVGGESARPGAQPVAEADEHARVIPVIHAILNHHPNARLAIDTVKANVAAAALRAGASIVNDVSAGRLDPRMAEVCADAQCTVVLMHSRGVVSDMASYEHAVYPRGVMTEVMDELQEAARRFWRAGVASSAIVLDPGLGFGKTPEQSLEILAQLDRLVALGFPVMVGASRKRFIGEVTGVHTPQGRDEGTIGANVVALARGARWFRVHAVRANRHALDVAAAALHQEVVTS